MYSTFTSNTSDRRQQTRLLTITFCLFAVSALPVLVGCSKKPTKPDPPTASFTATPTTGEADLTVSFFSNSVGEIDSYAWDFGDGSSSTEVNPTHTYRSKGDYAVSLAVTGPRGADQVVKSAYIRVSCTAPRAAFSTSVNRGTEPLTVTFSNQSSGSISRYEWDFGDGERSTAASPTHTYRNSGSFSVPLKVIGPCGENTEIKRSVIAVEAARSITFNRTWVTIDNSSKRVNLYTDFRVDGYRGQPIALGGYWFRKQGSTYYYQNSCKSTNVLGNYIGHQWTILPVYDKAQYSGHGFYTTWDCFCNQSGSYFGMIKVYNGTSTPIDVNHAELAGSLYVEIAWSSGRFAPLDEPFVQLRVLDEGESERLKLDIEAAGGIMHLLETAINEAGPSDAKGSGNLGF